WRRSWGGTSGGRASWTGESSIPPPCSWSVQTWSSRKWWSACSGWRSCGSLYRPRLDSAREAEAQSAKGAAPRGAAPVMPGRGKSAVPAELLRLADGLLRDPDVDERG